MTAGHPSSRPARHRASGPTTLPPGLRTAPVQTGADRLVADPGLVDGRRWGLVTNYTGVTSDLRLTSTALAQAGAPLVAILGPEHGIRGTAQAGASEDVARDEATGLPVLDTYLAEGPALDALLDDADVDTLLVDLQDIGVRYYTYVWTMVDCLRAAARRGVPLVVLDRPNPLGGLAVEGPDLDPAFASFVGRLPVPQRHGLTMGELALAVHADDARAGLPTSPVHVVTADGWERGMLWDQTGLAWVMPSPNVPTPETALAFAATGLVEGTLLSEGRGTTRPFELVGAPWLDARYAQALADLDLPGVVFRETWFTPTFHKFAGESVRGVQLHVTDPVAFEAVRTGVSMIAAAAALYPDDFGWRLPQAESEVLAAPRPFVDLLWGSDSLRTTVDAGGDATALVLPRTLDPSVELLYPAGEVGEDRRPCTEGEGKFPS